MSVNNLGVAFLEIFSFLFKSWFFIGVVLVFQISLQSLEALIRTATRRDLSLR